MVVFGGWIWLFTGMGACCCDGLLVGVCGYGIFGFEGVKIAGYLALYCNVVF